MADTENRLSNGQKGSYNRSQTAIHHTSDGSQELSEEGKRSREEQSANLVQPPLLCELRLHLQRRRLPGLLPANPTARLLFQCHCVDPIAPALLPSQRRRRSWADISTATAPMSPLPSAPLCLFSA